MAGCAHKRMEIEASGEERLSSGEKGAQERIAESMKRTNSRIEP